MDIKNSRESYARTVGLEHFDLAPVEESVSFLLSGTVDFEFRTTVADGLHTVEELAAIGDWLAGAKRYAIQNFVDSGDVLSDGLSPCPVEKLQAFLAAVRPAVPGAFIRGEG